MAFASNKVYPLGSSITVTGGTFNLPLTYNNVIGQPFVTVTVSGPSDGGNFGPNTPGTTTAGIQEAINASNDGVAVLLKGSIVCSNPVTLNKKVSLISFNSPTDTTGALTEYPVISSLTIQSDNKILDNITIQGIFFNNLAINASTFQIRGLNFRDCEIYGTNNSVSSAFFCNATSLCDFIHFSHCWFRTDSSVFPLVTIAGSGQQNQMFFNDGCRLNLNASIAASNSIFLVTGQSQFIPMILNSAILVPVSLSYFSLFHLNNFKNFWGVVKDCEVEISSPGYLLDVDWTNQANQWVVWMDWDNFFTCQSNNVGLFNIPISAPHAAFAGSLLSFKGTAPDSSSPPIIGSLGSNYSHKVSYYVDIKNQATTGFKVSSPSVPVGTGIGNSVTNNYLRPVMVYQASNASGTSIVDNDGNNPSLTVNPTNFILDAGCSVYYTSTVCSTWVWYGL